MGSIFPSSRRPIARATLVVAMLAMLVALLPAGAASAYASSPNDAAAPPLPPQNVQIIGEDGGLNLVWDRPPGVPTVKIYRLGFTPVIRGDSFWDLELGEPHVDVHIGGIPMGRDFTFSVQSVTDEGASAPIVTTMDGSYLALSFPTSVVHGSTVAIEGRLLDSTSHQGLAARAMRLYRKQPGSHGYQWISSKLTAPTGEFAFRPKAHRNASYFVRFPSESLVRLGSRTGKHAVDVRQKVTLKVSDTTVPKGTTVSFIGKVKPTRTGRVKLERLRSSGHWKVVARAALDTRGRYALARTLRSGTDFQWRVVVKKTELLARGVSHSRVIQVS